jgi:Ser/Thr protein kinase RdoA (MazF antagonist)
MPERDRRVVEQVARAERRIEAAPPSLLHGDCGAHNFLFESGSAEEHEQARVGRLVGVIDPDPLLGYPIYDLAFAFVSWPNGLRPEAIVPAAEALREAGRWRPNGDLHEALWDEVMIALYMRMATCLVQHPHDLPAYLEAWPRWRDMVA